MGELWLANHKNWGNIVLASGNRQDALYVVILAGVKYSSRTCQHSSCRPIIRPFSAINGVYTISDKLTQKIHNVTTHPAPGVGSFGIFCFFHDLSPGGIPSGTIFFAVPFKM
jgi:hypothetical protein